MLAEGFIEGGQEGGAGGGEDAAPGFDAMVEPVVGEVHGGAAAATTGIKGTKDQPGELHVNHGAGAHGAGLHGHKKSAVLETSQLLVGVPQDEHLRMEGRVVALGSEIVGFCYKGISLKQSRPYGRFSLVKGQLGFL